MTPATLEKLAAAAKPKDCPLCEAPAVVVWTNCYLGCLVICTDIGCRCKVERQGANCGPERVMRDALKAWNRRDSE